MQRRNPTRSRRAPKRYENEKFVSGAIDRYQHCYEANKKGKYDCINGHENYYTNRNGCKFNTIEFDNKGKYRIQKRDFSESLLEFTSIWRDNNQVLPGNIVSYISEYLRIPKFDKAVIADDDEFIVADEDQEIEYDNSDEEEWLSEDETEDDSEWDSDCLSDDD